jgi:hypothetical protein
MVSSLANGFPQSLSEVAVAVKQTDLNYYHSDVRRKLLQNIAI